MNGGFVSDEFEKWLATLPTRTAALARKYPPGTPVDLHGTTFYVVAYGEGKRPSADTIQLSKINPSVDYDCAVATRIRVHVNHFDDET